MTTDLSGLPSDLKKTVAYALDVRNKTIQTSRTAINRAVRKIIKDISKRYGKIPIDWDAERRVLADALEKIITTSTIEVSVAGMGVGASALERHLEAQGDPRSKMVRILYADRAKNFAREWLKGDRRSYKTGVKWNLSDAIWKLSGNNLDAIKSILDAGVGMDSVKVAKALSTYVNEGRATFAYQYPNMMDRMGKRIPKTLNYEALRLARNELSEVYWDSSLEGYRDNDAIEGVKVSLSNNRPAGFHDICDQLATENLYGLGPGVFPVGEAPSKPHIQCLCSLLPVVKRISQN